MDREEKLSEHICDAFSHRCKIKPVKFFDTVTYQCGCGKYYTKEAYERRKKREQT